MARKKKQPVKGVAIEAYAAEGKSIGYLEDGKVLFVENAIPGDVVNARIVKEKKSWAEGKITELLQPSPFRVEPFCPHFGVCGGCKWQMLPYEQQIVYKQQQVLDQLQRIGGIELPEMETILGSERERYYRNKLEFTFCTHRYRTQEEIIAANGEPFPIEPVLGFHAPGLFDKVVEIKTCYLQTEPTNLILNSVRAFAEANNYEYYDYRSHTGWLRNLIIRIARTGEILVNLVIQHEDEKNRKAILDHILQNVPGITTLHYTINPKVNDSIHDLEVHCYHGKGYIEETLEEFRYKISPKSFFQTNTYQAKRLYQTVREFADLEDSSILYDLYCGTGSIGIFCSKKAKKVIGIEMIDDAVKDARINASMNGLDNCLYYTGDVANICTEEFFAEHGKPDVIITDPPRAGMHEKLIEQILNIRAPKVVYVSCNPATQARDLKLMDSVYKVTRVKPVDMFPHTHHIENVVLLELR